MITNFKSFVHRNHQGSSFVSPAHGCGEARATMNFNNSPSAKKSGRSPKASGQKGRGLGGRNFCPLAEAKPRRPAR